MTEHKFFDTPVAFVSTFDYHRDRERAPHLEQDIHRWRLDKAAALIVQVGVPQRLTVSDIGCGDGGLLSLITPAYIAAGLLDFCWGYDFAPANAAGWAERGVSAKSLDVFNDPFYPIAPEVLLGDIVVMTEVLEHLTDPHGVLRHLATTDTQYIVASSPHDEGPGNHDASHAWAWDHIGYEKLFYDAGWQVGPHSESGRFQVARAERRPL